MSVAKVFATYHVSAAANTLRTGRQIIMAVGDETLTEEAREIIAEAVALELRLVQLARRIRSVGRLTKPLTPG